MRDIGAQVTRLNHSIAGLRMKLCASGKPTCGGLKVMVHVEVDSEPHIVIRYQSESAEVSYRCFFEGMPMTILVVEGEPVDEEKRFFRQIEEKLAAWGAPVLESGVGFSEGYCG